jgi:hypothetical protein
MCAEQAERFLRPDVLSSEELDRMRQQLAKLKAAVESLT